MLYNNIMNRLFSEPNTPVKANQSLLSDIKSQNRSTSHKNTSMQSQRFYSFEGSQKISEQRQLIRELIKTLGLKKTSAIFSKENKIKYNTNPEDSAIKIQYNVNQDERLLSKLRQVIEQAKDYEEMLNLFEQIVQNEMPGNGKLGKQTLKQRQDYAKLERSVQSLFKSKYKMTVPIHRTVEIPLDNLEVRLADLDEEENICYIDSANMLNVIMSAEGKHHNYSLKRKNNFTHLQWADEGRVILQSSNNQLFVYLVPEFKLIFTLKPEKQILKLDYQLFKGVIYVYGYTQKTLNILKTQRKHLDLQYSFQNTQYAKAITLLHSKKQSHFEMIINEHYYGVGKDQKDIIKFDTSVGKGGLFWSCPKDFKIVKFTISKCGQNLILVLTHRNLSEMRHENQEYLSFEYLILKIDDKGCVLERAKHIFDFQQFPLGFLSSEKSTQYLDKILSISLPMEPWWLRCFSWQNQIYYISLKTGKIVHRMAVDEQKMTLRAVGPTNSVLLNSHKNMILVSTKQGQKKVIEMKRLPKIQNTRETILQRFERMQGIPQNLLILLRSIRTNDLEALDFS